MTDPNKLVTVTVNQDRMYRAKHEDRTAITVKKGVPTGVPFWVAEHWGVLPADAPKPAKSLKTSKKGG